MIFAKATPNHKHSELVDGEKVIIQFDKDGNIETKDEKECELLQKHNGHPMYWEIISNTEDGYYESLKRSDLYNLAKERGWRTRYNLSRNKDMINFLKDEERKKVNENK